MAGKVTPTPVVGIDQDNVRFRFRQEGSREGQDE